MVIWIEWWGRKMVISGDFEKKVNNLWTNGERDLAKKEVFKFRAKYYNQLEVIEDKIFIDYKMAFHEYVDGNVEMANIYFKNLDDIFKDEYLRGSCAYDYYRYRWLYVNNNCDTLSYYYKMKEMTEIYNYFKKNDMNESAFSALETIHKIKGNENGVLESLKSLLNEKKIQEWNMVESILKDCDKISHDLYIKALDIIDRYKEDFNIDVV